MAFCPHRRSFFLLPFPSKKAVLLSLSALCSICRSLVSVLQQKGMKVPPPPSFPPHFSMVPGFPWTGFPSRGRGVVPLRSHLPLAKGLLFPSPSFFNQAQASPFSFLAARPTHGQGAELNSFFWFIRSGDATNFLFRKLTLLKKCPLFSLSHNARERLSLFFRNSKVWVKLHLSSPPWREK